MSAYAIEPAIGSGRDASAAPHAAAVDAPTLVIAAILASAAIAIQALWIPLDSDVSWLITVAERVLAGERLYIDIVEVNPPASVWLYMPLVWIAGLIGARPEAVVAGAFAVAGLTSAGATVRLASRIDDVPRHWRMGGLAFVALILPMGLFAQREHAALLLALPVLAAVAAVAAGKPISRAGLYASGFGAGLIVVIKPHFLLAIALPAIWAAWRRRSLAALWPALAAGSVPPVLYAVAVAMLTPAYFDWLAVLAHTYLPRRSETWKVLVGPLMFPAASLVLAALVRPRVSSPLASAWGLGAAGFIMAAFIQGKNYPNHWLPGAALALLALLTILSQPQVTRSRRVAVGAWVAVLALLELYKFTILPDEAVARTIERVAPPVPTIIALSPELTTGHPVTRNVGGRWAGSRAALFTAAGAKRVRFTDSIAAQAYRADIRAFVTDVQRHSPDVVLVDRESKAWLMREPEVATAMAGYEPVAAAKATEVWLRRGAAR